MNPMLAEFRDNLPLILKGNDPAEDEWPEDYQARLTRYTETDNETQPRQIQG